MAADTDGVNAGKHRDGTAETQGTDFNTESGRAGLYDDGLTFRDLRFQILYPCQARCRWCKTSTKNKIFRKLYAKGHSNRVHEEYLAIVRYFRPKTVRLSGGEPLLLPEINGFIRELCQIAEQVNIYTSYQYKSKLIKDLPWDDNVMSKVILTHTPMDFRRKKFSYMTRRFPFERYIENIRLAGSQRMRKEMKFVLNHENLEEQIDLFNELVQPDDTFKIVGKVVNIHNEFGAKSVEDTRNNVIENLSSSNDRLPPTSERKTNMLQAHDVRDSCYYRIGPEELRFALSSFKDDHVVLDYRFCPFFPGWFGHKYHVGQNSPHDIEKAFRGGKYLEACHDCRLMRYKSEPSESSE